MARRQSASPTGAERLADEVGGRVRALRTAAGVSLGALAASTGLGKGTLSELERGQRNPTLDTLFAVATALSVPLSHVLFGVAAEDASTGTRRTMARGRSVVADLLDRFRDDAGFTEVYRIDIEPRTQRSEPHLPGVVETLTVVGGVAEVGPAAEPVTLRAPESLTFPGDVAHVYRGVGGVATAVLVMYYPGEPAT